MSFGEGPSLCPKDSPFLATITGIFGSIAKALLP
jgi:hypothetical protein